MERMVSVVAGRVLVLAALGFAAGVGLGLLLREAPVIGAMRVAVQAVAPS